jgi:hypothetical protein
VIVAPAIAVVREPLDDLRTDVAVIEIAAIMFYWLVVG